MSKHTLYFNTVEEANQYFPDGVPSTVIAIVGDGSQVLVSSDNAATNTQQYYSADLTNDEIVNTMVQDSYDEGHSDGYAEGVVDGQADASANWLDILFLDEKAKAESFLGISDWGSNDFQKYNFAKYATSDIFIDQQSALAFISGLQNNKTMWKLIKISKDTDGNAVITYNTCSINFDGTNVGSFELDSNTYNNKICLWGTLTLAAGDEVIMSCATDVPNTISLGLFGGFDDETNDPATFKCETAGTYTFGILVDVPQVQNGEAECFVSTAFNYTGSATVPAIAVPTGETSGGSLTDTQIEQQSIGLFMTSRPTIIYNAGSFEIAEAAYDSEYLKSILQNQMGLYVDIYNENDGLYELTGTNNATENYVDQASDETGGEGYISATFHAEAGDKVGFGFYGLTTDPETGDTIVDQDITSQYSKTNYDSVNDTYKHFYDIATSGDYEARWQLSTDPESGNTVNEFTLEEVVQP